MVITVGGGGIPVVADEDGLLHGVPAVIDKDFASSLLATELGADVFVISHRGRAGGARLRAGREQRWVDRMTVSEAKAATSPRAPTSPPAAWRPRSRPASGSSSKGGREAVITDPEHLRAAVRGEAGTHIVRDA